MCKTEANLYELHNYATHCWRFAAADLHIYAETGIMHNTHDTHTHTHGERYEYCVLKCKFKTN